MPPLRERDADIMLLANHFAMQTGRRYGMELEGFTKEAQIALQEYDWPGNVREMKHLLERAVLLSGGDKIDKDILGLENSTPTTDEQAKLDEDMTLGDAELQLIKQALDRTNHNVSKAARELGITRMALRYRIKKYNL